MCRAEGRGSIAQRAVEGRLCAALEQQGIETAPHLPTCYGVRETNLGPGLVIDLVRNYDGEISRPLDWYLAQGMPVGTFDACFEEMIQAFLERLIQLEPGFSLEKLLVQKKSAASAHLVAIHGLGESVTRNRVNLFPALLRRRIRKRWNEQVAQLYQARDSRG